jgi:hypothetical protein
LTNSLTLSLVLIWFLLAIPRSLLARRLGHRMWPSYVAWCPFLGSMLLIWSLEIINAPLVAIIFIQSIVTWIPGAAYLWFLALRK